VQSFSRLLRDMIFQIFKKHNFPKKRNPFVKKSGNVTLFFEITK